MLSLILLILAGLVFGKCLWMVLRGAWGLTKILLTIVFFPVILIGLILSKLLILALPVLLIFGLISMTSKA